jgi:hypothetical protein
MTPAQKRVIDEAKIFVWFYRGLRDLEALTDAVVAVQKEEDDAPTLGMPTEIEICGCDDLPVRVKGGA